jgi:hypothetical protein
MEREKMPGLGVQPQTEPPKYYHADTYNTESPRTLAVGLSTPLEARWARFFDLLGVPWVPGWPLRFWLPFDGSEPGDYPRGFPNLKGLWVGVGEFPPSDEMRAQLREVARVSGHWCHLLIGPPRPGFEVWSWRLGDGRNIDGERGIADLVLTDDNQDSFCCNCFNVDFAINTVPSGGNVRRALEAVA